MKTKRIIDKSSMPSFLKRSITRGLKLHKVFTGHLRLLPNFVIIGAQRCGTTSLYNYLVKHPCVAPAFQKEVHFFDNQFSKGVDWYRAHFPLYKDRAEKTCKKSFVTGETSPYYIFHPHVPKRILETLPRVKLIALLRNPVDRAYSHYHQSVRRGIETLSFNDAIEREGERLHGEIRKILEDEKYHNVNHQRYSYLSRGIYVDQLKIWMRLFPKEQILILKSEDLFNDPPRIFKRVLEFLNLPNWELKEYKKYNLGYYPKMNANTRKRLIDYFEPHNQRLYEFLAVNFGWENIR